MVKADNNRSAWKLTCFYGHPVTAKRHESWALLEHLKQFQTQSWLCIGDFNKILTQEEKIGAILRREGHMDQFRNALGNCQLTDLGFIGSQYTWTNCRHDGNFVKECLDRVVANMEWRGIYREANVFLSWQHGRRIISLLCCSFPRKKNRCWNSTKALNLRLSGNLMKSSGV